jgi:hypothetical protein
MGQLDKGAELVERAREIRGDQIGNGEATWLYGVMAVIAWFRGDDAKALAAADKGAEYLRMTTPFCESTMEGSAGVTQVYLEAWEKAPNDADLQRKAHSSVKRLSQLVTAFPMAYPRSAIWSGYYYSLNGRMRKARRLWRSAIAAAHRLKMPYEEGLAHFYLGRSASVKEPERDMYLRKAVEILTGIGASFDSDRVKAVMRRHQ